MKPADLSALPEEEIAEGEAAGSSSPSSAFDQSSIPPRPGPQYAQFLQFWFSPKFFSIFLQQLVHFCRNSREKYAPLDWSGYFDKEEDVKIPESDDASFKCIFLVPKL